MARAATPLEQIQYFASEVEKLLEDLRASPLTEDEAFDYTPLRTVLEAWREVLSNPDVQALYNHESMEPPGARRTFPASMYSELGGSLYSIREGLTKRDFKKIRLQVSYLLRGFVELATKLMDHPGLFVTTSQRASLGHHEITARIMLAEDLQRQGEELLASTQESASKASEAATSASEAAGTAGESVMASYFKDFAVEEWKSATKFRIWTIVLLSVGGLLAAVFLLLPALGVAGLALDTGDYVHLAQRVVVTGAVFALAAYLARQSHQHRTLANWAKTLSVQLKTFDAFMAPLASGDAKEALRAQFAQRVFGEPPVLRGEASSGDSSAVPEKLWDILSRNLGKPQ